MMVALVATVKIACCLNEYNNIKQLLDTEKITVQQAQEMWLNHKKREQ